MAKPKLAYEIDDALGIEDNLTALGEAIDALDPTLSAVLKPKLASWSLGDAVELDVIWDALYDATATHPPEEVGDQA